MAIWTAGPSSSPTLISSSPSVTLTWPTDWLCMHRSDWLALDLSYWLTGRLTELMYSYQSMWLTDLSNWLTNQMAYLSKWVFYHQAIVRSPSPRGKVATHGHYWTPLVTAYVKLFDILYHACFLLGCISSVKVLLLRNITYETLQLLCIVPQDFFQCR